MSADHAEFYSRLRQRALDLLIYDPEAGTLRYRLKTGSKSAGSLVGRLSNGYIRFGLDGNQYLVHLIIWLIETGKWPDVRVDHRDGDKTNNRFGNLRKAGASNNAANSGARVTSVTGVKGVFPHGKGRFRSVLNVRGKKIDVGIFDTVTEAKAAYEKAADEHFGEFALHRRPAP